MTWAFGHNFYTREQEGFHDEAAAYRHAKSLRDAGVRARVAEGVKDGKPMFWVFIGVK